MLLGRCLVQQKIRTHTQLEAVFMAPITLGQQVACKAMAEIIYRLHMGSQIKWLKKGMAVQCQSQLSVTVLRSTNTSNSCLWVVHRTQLKVQNQSRKPMSSPELLRLPTNFPWFGPHSTWVLSVTKFKRRTMTTTSALWSSKIWLSKPPWPRLRKRKPI